MKLFFAKLFKGLSLYVISMIISYIINIFYHIGITFSKEKKNKIRASKTLISNAITPREIWDWFKLYYKEYEKEGIDWRPSYATAIVRGQDDCDGMAVMGIEALKAYCENKLKETPEWVRIYSFNLLGDRDGHAMTLAKTKDQYILFDYGHIKTYQHLHGPKKYYLTNYIKPRDPSAVIDDVYIMRSFGVHLPILGL